MESYNVLSNSQFGFRAKRSAEQQLLRTIHDFALNLNNKTQTDVILLDFCKAFDKVSHCLLLHKLDHYGSDVNYAKNYGNFSPENYITKVAQFLRQH